MKLIDDWKVEFHRLWSVRASVVLLALTQLLAILSAVGDRLNPRFLLAMFGVAIGGIVFLRFVKQTPKVNL